MLVERPREEERRFLVLLDAVTMTENPDALAVLGVLVVLDGEVALRPASRGPFMTKRRRLLVGRRVTKRTIQLEAPSRVRLPASVGLVEG